MATKRKKAKKATPEDRVPRPKVRKRPDLEPVDQRLMKALSHSLRVQILTLINERPWSPNELSKELDEGLSQVSYHVKVLKDLKCIEMVDARPVRGAVEHFYSPVVRIVVPEGMSAELPKSARLEMLGRIINDAERDIRESLEAGTFYQREDFHASWTPMNLDEQGCRKLHERSDEYLEDILEIAGESANRVAAEEAEAIPVSVALFGFMSPRKPGEKSTAHRRRA